MSVTVTQQPLKMPISAAVLAVEAEQRADLLAAAVHLTLHKAESPVRIAMQRAIMDTVPGTPPEVPPQRNEESTLLGDIRRLEKAQGQDTRTETLAEIRQQLAALPDADTPTLQAALHKIEGAENSAPAAETVPTLIVEVESDLLEALQNFKKGPLPAQIPAPDVLESALADVDALLDKALQSLPDENPASLPIQAGLLEKGLQLGRVLASHKRVTEIFDALKELRKLPLEERSHALQNEAHRWQQGKEEQDIMVPADLQILQKATAKEMQDVLDIFASTDPQLSELRGRPVAGEVKVDQPLAYCSDGLGELALLSGLEPLELGKTVSVALAGLSCEQKAELLPRAVQDMHGGTPVQKMQAVDRLFQGGYPDLSAEALSLKKALLPSELRAGVECQHQLVQSLHMLQQELLDAPGQHFSRTALVDRAQGQVLPLFEPLTPEKAQELCAKVDMANANYHLANVALLQMTALDYGLIDASPDEESQLKNVNVWSNALRLTSTEQNDVREVQEILNSDKPTQALVALLEANDRFLLGFSGAADAERADTTASKISSHMFGHRSAERRRENLFRTDPGYSARLALNSHLADLAHLTQPQDRLLDPHTGMALNGANIDAKMNVAMDMLQVNMSEKLNASAAKIGMKISGNLTVADLPEVRRRHNEALHGLQQRRGRFLQHVDTVQKLAGNIDEAITLRAHKAETHGRLDKHQSVSDGLRFIWPHQTAARRSVCDDVLALKAIREELSTGPALVPEMEARQAELVDRLSKIDPHSLLSSRRFTADNPHPDALLRALLPGVEAVNYFHSGAAKQDIKSIMADAHALHTIRHQIYTFTHKAERLVGRESVRTLERAVVAALLKTFVEQGADAGTFSVKDDDTRKLIHAQLSTWGLDASKGLLQGLESMVLANMSHGDGTLDMARLQREIKRLDDPDAKNATVAQGRFQEGLDGIMTRISQPGQGIVYSRTRGLRLNTGAAFSPSALDSISRINTKHKLAVRVNALHDDSLTVFNTGKNTYQVILKGKNMASVAASLNIPVPAGFLVNVTAGAGGERSKGLALTFANEASCRNFLEAFIDPSGQSSEQPQLPPNPSRLWKDATQVHFVDGRGVSANLSLSVSHTLFQHKLAGSSLTAKVLGAASLSFAGGLNQTVETNAQGETAVFERYGSVSVGLSASTSVGNSDTARSIGFKNMGKSVSAQAEMTQRFKLSTGPEGIASKTCMEMECSKGSLTTEDLIEILLPPKLHNVMKDNQLLYGDVWSALSQAPPTARLKVRWDITPQVLNEVRSLFVQARRAPDDSTQKALKDKAHDLLASSDSYEPVTFSVSTAKPRSMRKTHSVNMGPLYIVRENALLDSRTNSIDLPRLSDLK